MANCIRLVRMAGIADSFSLAAAATAFGSASPERPRVMVRKYPFRERPITLFSDYLQKQFRFIFPHDIKKFLCFYFDAVFFSGKKTFFNNLSVCADES